MAPRPVVALPLTNTLLRWNTDAGIWTPAPHARSFLPWLHSHARIWWFDRQAPHAGGRLAKSAALWASTVLGIKRVFFDPQAPEPLSLPAVTHHDWRWISAEWPAVVAAHLEAEVIAPHWIACNTTRVPRDLGAVAERLQADFGWAAPRAEACPGWVTETDPDAIHA